MLLWETLLGIAAMACRALAQTPEQLHAMQAAQASYPDCSLQCMAQLIPSSRCTDTDYKCLCTNNELNEQISTCVLEGCTTFEGLQTKNISMTMCGAPTRDKASTPLIVGLVGGAFALLAFMMRVCAPLTSQSRRHYGLDDYFATAAVALAVPPTAFAVTLTNNGLGKDMWTLELQSIKNVLMFYYLGSVFYIASITMIKLSIMAFILRVFPNQKFRRICYAVLALIVGYGVAFVLSTALQCWPAQYAWQQVDSSYKGHCNNVHLQGWMSAIFNIIIDIIMLILPLKHLWALQMRLQKKLLIMIMFSLGVFVTIVSIIRLRSLIFFANSSNITWDYVEAAYWSTLEIHIGIICCCLPSCRQLLKNLGSNILKRNKGSNISYQPTTTQSGNPRSQETIGASRWTDPVNEGDHIRLVDYPRK